MSKKPLVAITRNPAITTYGPTVSRERFTHTKDPDDSVPLPMRASSTVSAAHKPARILCAEKLVCSPNHSSRPGTTNTPPTRTVHPRTNASSQPPRRLHHSRPLSEYALPSTIAGESVIATADLVRPMSVNHCRKSLSATEDVKDTMSTTARAPAAST